MKEHDVYFATKTAFSLKLVKENLQQLVREFKLGNPCSLDSSCFYNFYLEISREACCRSSPSFYCILGWTIWDHGSCNLIQRIRMVRNILDESCSVLPHFKRCTMHTGNQRETHKKPACLRRSSTETKQVKSATRNTILNVLILSENVAVNSCATLE